MGRKSGSFFDMQFVTSSISTMLVLLLLGIVVFFVMAANNLSIYVRENIAFSVLVSDDMKEPDILNFQKQLNKEPYVKQTTYISKAQALKEQTEAMGTDPAEFIGHNPFTASIEIKLNADYANSDSIAWIKDEIQSNKQVIEINYPQDLLDAVNSNIRKISIVLLGLAALLTLISFAAGGVLQPIHHSYHEAGRSELVVHPAAVPITQRMDRGAGGYHGRCHTGGTGLHAGKV